MNADQLPVGTASTSPKQEAVPTLRIRALMLGDRINASGLEIGTLVSSTPAAFRVHAGLAVIFRYGVVVLIGLLPSSSRSRTAGSGSSRPARPSGRRGPPPGLRSTSCMKA